MNNKLTLTFRNPLHALKDIREEPKEAAKGYALGIFFAMTPLVCIKVVITLIIASILRWNRAAATVGVLTANPLTVPFIFSSAYFVGAAILGMDSSIDINTLFSQQGFAQLLSESKDIIIAMFVGGTLVGLVASVLAYYLSYFALRKRQDINRPSLQPSPVMSREF